MRVLLQAELLKLRTTRTFLALATLAVASSLLLAGLVASLTEPTRESAVVDVFASDLSAVFIVVLAVIGITGQWRHRTITGALLAAPDRTRFLAAKTIAFAAAGLALSVLVSIAVALLAFVILTARDLPLPGAGELAEHIARGALVAALLGAFGVAIGALVRNQVVAIVSLLLLALVVEPAVLTLAPNVGRFGHLARGRRDGGESTSSRPASRCWPCSRGSPSRSPAARRCFAAATWTSETPPASSRAAPRAPTAGSARPAARRTGRRGR